MIFAEKGVGFPFSLADELPSHALDATNLNGVVDELSERSGTEVETACDGASAAPVGDGHLDRLALIWKKVRTI